MFRLLFDKLFYSPYRVVKKRSNILVANDAVLMSSCKFRFDSSKSDNIVEIGSGSIIGCQFIFESNEGGVVIGSKSFINSDTRLISRSSIVIGSNVTIAWGCTIYDHNSHSLSYLDRRKDLEQQLSSYKASGSLTDNKDWGTVVSSAIEIQDDAWIGFGSTILKGVTVGKGAVVGANSVVREDVPPWTLVAGNPAVVIKRLRS